MAERPSETAEYTFNRVAGFYGNSTDRASLSNIAYMLQEMSKGLSALSVGLRATYNLLDEVNRKLDQPRFR